MAFTQLPSGGKANPGAGYGTPTGVGLPGIGAGSYTPSILLTTDTFGYENIQKSFRSNFDSLAAWLLADHAANMGINRTQASILSEIQSQKPFTNSANDLFSVINTVYESRNGPTFRMSAGQIGASVKDAFESFIYATELFSSYLLGRNFSYDVSYANFSLEGVTYKPGGLLTSYKTSAFNYSAAGLGLESSFTATGGNDLVYIGKSTGQPVYTGAGHDVVIFGSGGQLVVDEAGNDLYSFSGNASSNALAFTTNVADKNISRDGYGSIILQDRFTGDVDTASGVERLYFIDGTVAFDTGEGEVAGSAYRLYQAAFGRVPDQQGLGYWIHQMDIGVSLKAVAESFLAAPEFASLYGNAQNVSNARYVELLYANTLGRTYDQGGFNYWVNKLDTGQTSRGDLLAFFSESTENQQRVASAIDDGIWFV